MTIVAAIALACAAGLPPAPCRAQSHDPEARLTYDGIVSVTLDHPLAPGDGELALVVDGVDVSAVARRTPSSISYRPTAIELEQGDREVALYRRNGNRWSEIRRFTLTIAQTGASAAATAETATLGNTGQLAERHSAGTAAPQRRTFQDFVLNAGLRSSRDENGVLLTTQSNYVGVTRREQALRFGTLASRAPMFDLSDYLVTMQRSSATLAVGHVTFGSSRHLANGFAARGGTFTLAQGPTTVVLGALNGSSQVGWDDVVGLARPSDRLFGAAIGRELAPSHPGSLRFDVTLLDGSKAPLPSFTRGAVVDAERSAGGTMQMTAALPNQRLRLTGGFTRSRFENPANDAQLLGDSLTRRPRPATRDARFVEASAALLQNAKLPVIGATNLTVGGRDERVDPLFGSVAAQPAADRQEDAADATLSLGAVTAQASQSFARDNLGKVASILTTNTIVSTGSVALTVAKLVGVESRAAWFPIVTVGHNRTHQLAANSPTNGAFRPQDLPDQLSASSDAAAQWQIGRVRAALHLNRAAQDNREDQRQNADFATGVDGVTLGTTIGSGDVAVDASNEYQTSKERQETTRVHRYTVTSSLPLPAAFRILAALSAVDTRPPAGASSLIGEQHVELSRSLRLWPGESGAERGQAFVRWARTSTLAPDPTLVPPVVGARLSREQWTVASGLNLRLF